MKYILHRRAAGIAGGTRWVMANVHREARRSGPACLTCGGKRIGGPQHQRRADLICVIPANAVVGQRDMMLRGLVNESTSTP